MEDSTIIQKFLDYLKFERRFSEHTAKCYGADLIQFGDFLKGSSESDHPGSELISPSHHEAEPATAVATKVDLKVDQSLLSAQIDSVRSYLGLLNEKQYSKATIARKLATLRSFYKFLVKRNYIISNPVVSIRTPKQEKKLPRFLEYEDIKEALQYASWLTKEELHPVSGA